MSKFPGDDFLWIINFAYSFNSSYNKIQQANYKQLTLAISPFITINQNQFMLLYSFGVTPTRCLKSLVKCCGYLNPNS
jgi:hypothetical protein